MLFSMRNRPWPIAWSIVWRRCLSSENTAQALPSGLVTVTIGNQPATVLYAGAATGIVSGVIQINVVIPAGLFRPPAACDLNRRQRQSPKTSLFLVLPANAPPDWYVTRSPWRCRYRLRRRYQYTFCLPWPANAPANPNTIAVIDPSSGAVLNYLSTIA